MTFIEWWQKLGIFHGRDTVSGLIEPMAFAALTWEAAQPRWRPISTAPEREHMLILVDDMTATGNTYDGNWWATMPNGDVYELDSPPTHWMPLPQPPKEQ